MNDKPDSQRREFLKRAGGLALSCLPSARMLSAAGGGLSNPAGCATISWPKSELDHAVKTISQLGFKGVQLLGWVREAYAGDKAKQLRDHLSALHLQPVALSCSGLKLDPGNLNDVSAGFRAYAVFFRQMGGKYLQITDGGRPRANYSSHQIRALGKALNDLGKMAQDEGLEMAYHPHIGTLGETREGLGRVLDATDPRYVRLIADVAHLTLGGADPVEVIRAYHTQLIFCHFKDVRKDAAALFKNDPDAGRRAKYHFTEVGTGVVDFPAIVRAFRDTHFRGWVIVELDGNEHGAGGPDESARMNKSAIEKLGLRI